MLLRLNMPPAFCVNKISNNEKEKYKSREFKIGSLFCSKILFWKRLNIDLWQLKLFDVIMKEEKLLEIQRFATENLASVAMQGDCE